MAAGRWLLSVGRWLLAVGRWPLAAGRWPLAAGRWPLAAYLWPLASGRWSLAVGRWPDEKKIVKKFYETYHKRRLDLNTTREISDSSMTWGQCDKTFLSGFYEFS
jgi:hypothetical protein